MGNETAAKQFFKLNLKYSQMLEQAGGRVILHGEDAVLYWLYELDRPLLSGEISQLMKLSSGRTANILNSLERKGLVSRKRNSSDKRQVSVCLTKAGKSRIDLCYKECIRWCEDTLEKLAAKDVDHFLGLAEQILE